MLSLLRRLVLLVALCLFMLGAASASADVRIVAPLDTRGAESTFDLRPIVGRSIVSTTLLQGARSYRVDVRRVRSSLRDGRVRVRLVRVRRGGRRVVVAIPTVPRRVSRRAVRPGRPARHRVRAAAVRDLRVVSAPETTITSGPADTVTSTSATFSFRSSQKPERFSCRLDGGAWHMCKSPATFGGLAAAAHVFEVRASDKAGNTDPTPASRAWTIAANPPAPAPAPEPAPEPEPEPEPGVCPSGPYGAGAWAPACWNPFAANSPFNRRLPAAPMLLPGSSEKGGYLTSQGAPLPMGVNNADTSSDWLHPYFFAKYTDPLYTLHCTKSWGTCAMEGVKIHVPAGARPAAGGDGHLTVMQPDGWEYSMWQAKVDHVAKTISMSWTHGRTRMDGDGLNGGGTAAWFSNLAGIIRAQEMEAGEINHALFAIVRCSDGSAVYPAKSGTTARTCNSLGVASGGKSVPMGARLWLDMSDAQIDALAVPAWKKTILKALAHYGAIVGDTGAYGQSYSFGLQFESGTTYTAMGHADKMAAWAATEGYTARPSYMGLGNIIDWGRYLRVVHPCVSQGTC